MRVTEQIEQELKTVLVYNILHIVTVDGAGSTDARPGGWEKVLPAQDDPNVDASDDRHVLPRQR
jgi:hypothetical protein